MGRSAARCATEKVTAGDEVAFARQASFHMTGRKTDGEAIDLWFRQPSASSSPGRAEDHPRSSMLLSWAEITAALNCPHEARRFVEDDLPAAAR